MNYTINKMKKTIKIIAIIAISTSIFIGCKTEKAVTTVTKEEKVTTNEIAKEETLECDSKITYSASIKPIMKSACVKCHSGEKPKHGIDLTTYENVKAATGHNLLCTIQGGDRCPKMPPFGGSLSAEEVKKVECWIKNGMKE